MEKGQNIRNTQVFLTSDAFGICLWPPFTQVLPEKRMKEIAASYDVVDGPNDEERS